MARGGRAGERPRSRDLPVTATWRWTSPPGTAFLLHDDHVVWDAPQCRSSWFGHRMELDHPPEDLDRWWATWDLNHSGKGVGRAFLCWETPLDAPLAALPERFAPARMLGLAHEGEAIEARAALPLCDAVGEDLDRVIDGLVAQWPGYGPGYRLHVRWLYQGIAARGGRTLAAFHEGRAVAAASVVPGPGGRRRFQEVWTDPGWRRRGLATAIVGRLLGGRSLLQADEDGEALRIYLRLGFRPVSRVVEISRANE